MQLQSGELDFQLLLPDEDAKLEERVIELEKQLVWFQKQYEQHAETTIGYDLNSHFANTYDQK